MNTTAQFLFLGTGGSLGVPLIGCSCDVCTSGDPHNKRLRPSALLTVGNRRILIDCTPDFRAQALSVPINSIDGLILTHAHHDHSAGIDELRIISARSQQAIPCLCSMDTAKDIKERFHFLFNENNPYASGRMLLDFQYMEGERGDTIFFEAPIHYFSYWQGGMRVNGLRIGNFAYVSDIRDYTETVFEDLKGVEILVLSALRYTPSPLHFTVDEAIDFSKRVGAKKTFLTHISHDLDHELTNSYLPENIQLAYDGLNLEFDLGKLLPLNLHF